VTKPRLVCCNLCGWVTSTLFSAVVSSQIQKLMFHGVQSLFESKCFLRDGNLTNHRSSRVIFVFGLREPLCCPPDVRVVEVVFPICTQGKALHLHTRRENAKTKCVGGRVFNSIQDQVKALGPDPRSLSPERRASTYFRVPASIHRSRNIEKRSS